ncbi:MAG TPA: flagellar biosynthetic protein FliQ [Myxococcota bacterium]|jgi:flagellar biosynthetic protein FliQ
MTVELATALLQETIRTSLFVIAPVLGGALLVGLGISVLQTATQINDQTLTFVPKIATVLVLFALLFPWIMGTMVEFAARAFALAGGTP